MFSNISGTRQWHLSSYIALFLLHFAQSNFNWLNWNQDGGHGWMIKGYLQKLIPEFIHNEFQHLLAHICVNSLSTYALVFHAVVISPIYIVCTGESCKSKYRQCLASVMCCCVGRWVLLCLVLKICQCVCWNIWTNLVLDMSLLRMKKVDYIR